MTQEQYDDMLQAQGGVCAICKKPETSRKNNIEEVRPLAVDHCHSGGHVRSILCAKCNLILGKAQDDIALLRAAADYLEADASKRDTPTPSISNNIPLDIHHSSI